MERGNLVIYDDKGVIFSQSGQARGDILPHVIPVGIPYIIEPYDALCEYYVLSVDVSETPHKLIKKLISEKTEQDLAEEIATEAIKNKQEAYQEYVVLKDILGADSVEALAAKEAYLRISAANPDKSRYELEQEVKTIPGKIDNAKDELMLELIEGGLI